MDTQSWGAFGEENIIDAAKTFLTFKTPKAADYAEIWLEMLKAFN